ncbi:hypothetical protein JCM6882_007677 [Rhodosporidiobolus microsporus]
MSTPRPHLLPSFDPSKAKIAELRGILLEHDIPYASNAKKTDLVKLFEKHVRPQAATLLAASSAVRPSSHGILDGESQSGSLHELDTDSEEERRFEEEQAQARKKGRKSLGAKGKGRKSLSEAIKALEGEEEAAEGGKTPRKPSLAGKGKKPARKGKGKEREEEEDDDDDTSEDELAARPKSAKKGRKSSRPEPEPELGSEEDDELAGMQVEEEEPARHVSPKKRKAQDPPAPATPRDLPTLKTHQSALKQQLESPFSDYNPFQSGGEETPGRDAKRRKSSLGPKRLKERKSQTFGGRKSMPAPSSSLSQSHADDHERADSSPHAAGTAGEWASSAPSPAKRARKSDVPPVPKLAASSFFAQPGGGAGGSGSGVRSAPPGSVRKERRPAEDGGREGKKRRSAPVVEPEPEPQEDEEDEEDEEVEEEEEEDVEMADEPAYDQEEEEDPEASFEQEMALEEQDDEAYEPEPEPEPAPRSASRGPRTSAGGTPLGQKYMVPVAKVKTTPPHIAEQLRQFNAASSASANGSGTPAKAYVPQQQQQQQHDTRTVSIQEKHHLGRHSEPSPRDSPAVKKLLSQVGPSSSGSSPAGAQGTPPRRSLPVAAERQLATRAPRAAPAPPTPKSALRDAVVFSSPQRSRFASSLGETGSVLASSIPADLARVLKWALVGLLALYAAWYREETLAAGFCDTSSSALASSNPLVSSRASSGQTSLAFPSLPSLPSPLLHALDSTGLRPSCTPCPSHGVCSQSLFTGCTADYVPRPSLLRTLTLGLVPAAPTCEADTEKQVAVARQASVAGRVLRRRRGEVMCERRVERGRKREAKALGLGEIAGEEEEEGRAEEAYVYGLEAEGVMKALARENEASGAPFSDEVFDEISRLALRDLDTHGEVIVWQNGDTFWYASKTAEMSLSCRARLAAIRSAKKHKLSLFSILSTLFAALWARQKLRRRVEDKERVRQLVQAALRQLQQQERSHYASPALVPYPHLAPSHLRDLLLTSVHSPARRAALWTQVEKVVEGNANVRVGEVEVGGEEMRGWRWTGPTQAIEDATGRGGREEGQKEMVQVGQGVVGTPTGKGTPVK